jgi:hypothetical protein
VKLKRIVIAALLCVFSAIIVGIYKTKFAPRIAIRNVAESISNKDSSTFVKYVDIDSLYEFLYPHDNVLKRNGFPDEIGSAYFHMSYYIPDDSLIAKVKFTDSNGFIVARIYREYSMGALTYNEFESIRLHPKGLHYKITGVIEGDAAHRSNLIMLAIDRVVSQYYEDSIRKYVEITVKVTDRSCKLNNENCPFGKTFLSESIRNISTKKIKTITYLVCPALYINDEQCYNNIASNVLPKQTILYDETAPWKNESPSSEVKFILDQKDSLIHVLPLKIEFFDESSIDVKDLIFKSTGPQNELSSKQLVSYLRQSQFSYLADSIESWEQE